MNIRKADRGPRKRGVPRAVELAHGEQKQTVEFDPKEFLSGRDRHYLDDLIHKPDLQENELEVLSQSWWVSSLDEGYLQDLAQAQGLEGHMWSEIERFRDMYLKPFGEPKELAELSPVDATQVLINYLDSIKLLSIFPDSSHKKEVFRLFEQEKHIFLKLLESTGVRLDQKLMILFFLIHFTPEQKTQLKGNISVEDVRQEVKKTQDLDMFMTTLVLFPELRPEVDSAFEQQKLRVEKNLRELKKSRFSGTSQFTNYLTEAFQYMVLTGPDVSPRPNGTFNIRLHTDRSYVKPPLPERPSV